MSTPSTLRLFEAFGIELEYMIVDRHSLDVRPIADELLRAAAGTDEYVGDVELGEVSCSNELVAHVVELKTTQPARDMATLPVAMSQRVRQLNALLERWNARLMPTAMHPWMDPAREMKLWPHEYGEVYATFDLIFDCRGHGWSNLQSVHINLPFAGDDEFARLHAAVRLVLPLLPALAASSPIYGGRGSGLLDSRLQMYSGNSRNIPAVAGLIVPEAVFTEADYHREIFARIDAAIAPHDPGGVLHHQWVNARGAIARFDRGAIEIRLLDVQECPAADLAICGAIVGVLKLLCQERWTPLAEQQRWGPEMLAEMLRQTIEHADQAMLANPTYARQFGLETTAPVTAGQLWRHLLEVVASQPSLYLPQWAGPWQVLMEEGPLARRILHAVGNEPSRERLAAVYRQLCDCLEANEMYRSGIIRQP